MTKKTWRMERGRKRSKRRTRTKIGSMVSLVANNLATFNYS